MNTHIFFSTTKKNSKLLRKPVANAAPSGKHGTRKPITAHTKPPTLATWDIAGDIPCITGLFHVVTRLLSATQVYETVKKTEICFWDQPWQSGSSMECSVWKFKTESSISEVADFQTNPFRYFVRGNVKWRKLGIWEISHDWTEPPTTMGTQPTPVEFDRLLRLIHHHQPRLFEWTNAVK